MIRIVQWNIWFKENPQSIAAELSRLNTDIVCLQEVTQGFDIHGGLDVAGFIAKHLGFNLYFKEAHRWSYDYKQDEVIGNAILSRYPLTQNNYFYVQTPRAEQEEVYAKQGRVYIESVVKLPHRDLRVATVHLSYTNKFQTMPHQQYETEKLIAIINDKKRDFVLTGDFNAVPPSDVVHRVEHYLNNLGPPYAENTWPSQHMEIDGVPEPILGWRIDYVFGTPDLTVSSATIHTSEFSDHLPIIVEINDE